MIGGGTALYFSDLQCAIPDGRSLDAKYSMESLLIIDLRN